MGMDQDKADDEIKFIYVKLEEIKKALGLDYIQILAGRQASIVDVIHGVREGNDIYIEKGIGHLAARYGHAKMWVKLMEQPINTEE